MTIDLNIFNEIKFGCQSAMANRLATIIHHNFGFSGEDRPERWPALSADYAREFHDGNRIPTLQLKGDLQQSIEIDESLEKAVVFTDNPYAESQQYGDETKNLPARPFFPLAGDELTAYSEAQCIAAAEAELERILNKN